MKFPLLKFPLLITIKCYYCLVMSGHVRPSEQQSGTSIVPTQQGTKFLLTRNKFLVVLDIKVAVVISAETFAYQTSKSYSLRKQELGAPSTAVSGMLFSVPGPSSSSFSHYPLPTHPHPPCSGLSGTIW